MELIGQGKEFGQRCLLPFARHSSPTTNDALKEYLIHHTWIELVIYLCQRKTRMVVVRRKLVRSPVFPWEYFFVKPAEEWQCEALCSTYHNLGIATNDKLPLFDILVLAQIFMKKRKYKQSFWVQIIQPATHNLNVPMRNIHEHVVCSYALQCNGHFRIILFK